MPLKKTYWIEYKSNNTLGNYRIQQEFHPHFLQNNGVALFMRRDRSVLDSLLQFTCCVDTWWSKQLQSKSYKGKTVPAREFNNHEIKFKMSRVLPQEHNNQSSQGSNLDRSPAKGGGWGALPHMSTWGCIGMCRGTGWGFRSFNRVWIFAPVRIEFPV